ncbi:MAG: oligosaccharide repeat unit polymerase [Hyphomicrobiaceae bacterium]
MLLFLALWQPETVLDADRGKLTFYVSTCAVVTTIHLIVHSERNWLRVDTLFLLSFLIVNIQWPAMILVDQIVPEEQLTAFRLDKNLPRLISLYMTYGTWLSAIGLTTWALGYLIGYQQMNAGSRRRQHPFLAGPRKSLQSDEPKVITPRLVTIKGRFASHVIFLGLLIIFLMLVGPGFLFGETYSKVRAGGFVTLDGIAAYVHVLLVLFAIAVFSLEAYILKRRYEAGERLGLADLLLNVGLCALLAYTLVFLLAGARSEVIQVMALASLIVGSCFRAIRLWEFFVAIAVGSLLFTIIGHVRSHGWGDLALFLNDFNPWLPTVNLANSAISVYLGVEVIEERGGLFWGQTFLTNILSAVPLLTGWVSRTFEISSFDMSSAYYFARHLYGPNPHTGPGTGIVADSYVNFGVAGVAVCLAIYGCLCGICQSQLLRANRFREFLVAAAFASLVFYMPRSSLFFQVQPVIWSLALTYLLFRENSNRVQTGLSPRSGRHWH